jgi:hypothetical protein
VDFLAKTLRRKACWVSRKAAKEQRVFLAKAQSDYVFLAKVPTQNQFISVSLQLSTAWPGWVVKP